MLETKVAIRYAKSLIELARERGVADAVKADMQLLVGVCAMNREFPVLLANPIVHGYKKRAILKQVFETKVNSLTNSFFDILVKKGREGFLEGIAHQYLAQYKKFKGIETAVITSAVGLDDTLRAAVYKIISESLNSEIELIEKVDKRIIGGLIVRVEDKQYDASISSELKKLARAFAVNGTVQNN